MPARHWSIRIMLLLISTSPLILLITNTVSWVNAGFIGLAGVAFHFTRPDVARPWRNKVPRWWELRPRYILNTRATIDDKGRPLACTVIHLSEGGTLIRTPHWLNSANEVRLHFTLLGHDMELPCRVLDRRWWGLGGYKLEFQLTAESHHQMTRLIKGLNRLSIPSVAREARPCTRTRQAQAA